MSTFILRLARSGPGLAVAEEVLLAAGRMVEGAVGA